MTTGYRGMPRERMRVLMVVDSTSPRGGVEMNALEVSAALAERNVIGLIYRDPGTLLDQYRDFAGLLVADKLSAQPASISSGFLAQIKAFEPDVIYVNRPHRVAYGIKMGRRLNVPIVCHIHGLAERRIRLLVPRLQGNVSEFIAVSKFVANEWARAGIRSAALSVVRNGVNVDRYTLATDERRLAARGNLGLPKEAPIAAFLGRATVAKGADVLARAWRIVVERRPDAVLLLGGATVDGSIPVEFEGLESSVRSLPRTNDVVPYLHAANVLLFPSTAPEGLPRVPLEAMSCGVPVIASDVGGTSEAFTRDLQSFLIEAGDHQSLAAKTVELLSQPLGGLALRLRSHVSHQHPLSRTVDEIEQVLRRAASGMGSCNALN